MSNAAQYQPHYTAQDYEQWEGDWELWNGIPVSMSPSPSFEHQRIATNLVFLIKQQLEGDTPCRRCIVVGECDWHIGDDTVVRPDVLVTCDPPPSQHLVSPPAFIAEILSPSTANKDRTAKRALYEAHGVRYYAMLDPTDASVELLDLVDGVYRQVDMKAAPIRLKLTSDCSISGDHATWESVLHEPALL